MLLYFSCFWTVLKKKKRWWWRIYDYLQSELVAFTDDKSSILSVMLNVNSNWFNTQFYTRPIVQNPSERFTKEKLFILLLVPHALELEVISCVSPLPNCSSPSLSVATIFAPYSYRNPKESSTYIYIYFFPSSVLWHSVFKIVLILNWACCNIFVTATLFTVVKEKIWKNMLSNYSVFVCVCLWAYAYF